MNKLVDRLMCFLKSDYNYRFFYFILTRYLWMHVNNKHKLQNYKLYLINTIYPQIINCLKVQIKIFHKKFTEWDEWLDFHQCSPISINLTTSLDLDQINLRTFIIITIRPSSLNFDCLQLLAESWAWTVFTGYFIRRGVTVFIKEIVVNGEIKGKCINAQWICIEIQGKSIMVEWIKINIRRVKTNAKRINISIKLKITKT